MLSLREVGRLSVTVLLLRKVLPPSESTGICKDVWREPCQWHRNDTDLHLCDDAVRLRSCSLRMERVNTRGCKPDVGQSVFLGGNGLECGA